jgi:hypothetical protein
MDSLLPFAKSMVSEHGSFNPFGAIMYAAGEIQWVAVGTGEEFPSSQVLTDSLKEVFKGKAASGEIRAATVCYDARTIPPGGTIKMDVISFALEHRSGNSIDAFLPYSRGEKEDVEYGELFTVKRPRQFFVD